MVVNYFFMFKKDVAKAMKCPWQKISTDDIVGGHSRPRTYSSFPQVLGFLLLKKRDHFDVRGYSKDDHGEPARRLSLWDRGLIRQAMSADLSLFNPNKIKDQNYFVQPKIFPVGIRAIWVKRKLIYCEFQFG